VSHVDLSDQNESRSGDLCLQLTNASRLLATQPGPYRLHDPQVIKQHWSRILQDESAQTHVPISLDEYYAMDALSLREAATTLGATGSPNATRGDRTAAALRSRKNTNLRMMALVDSIARNILERVASKPPGCDGLPPPPGGIGTHFLDVRDQFCSAAMMCVS
jgi:hypothetical protein